MVDYGFVCILCMAMPLWLWCRIVVGLPWFSSCLFFVMPFMFGVWGIGWQRGTLMEPRENWMKPNR